MGEGIRGNKDEPKFGRKIGLSVNFRLECEFPFYKPEIGKWANEIKGSLEWNWIVILPTKKLMDSSLFYFYFPKKYICGIVIWEKTTLNFTFCKSPPYTLKSFQLVPKR